MPGISTRNKLRATRAKLKSAEKQILGLNHKYSTMKSNCKRERVEKIKALKRVDELENTLKFYQMQHSFPPTPSTSAPTNVVNPFLFMTAPPTHAAPKEAISVESVDVPAYML